MREVKTTLYTFDELSDNSKQQAIDKHRYINADYEWWDYIYFDAKEFGLKISSFDIDRRSIGIEYIDNPNEVAEKILKEYGENTYMYEIAKYYLAEYTRLKKLLEDEDDMFAEDDMDSLNNEFLRELGEHFLSVLNSDYEWRISDESISEYLTDNGYEFTEHGIAY